MNCMWSPSNDTWEKVDTRPEPGLLQAQTLLTGLHEWEPAAASDSSRSGSQPITGSLNNDWGSSEPIRAPDLVLGAHPHAPGPLKNIKISGEIQHKHNRIFFLKSKWSKIKINRENNNNAATSWTHLNGTGLVSLSRSRFSSFSLLRSFSEDAQFPEPVLVPPSLPGSSGSPLSAL